MSNNAFLPAQEFRKMIYQEPRNRGRWLTGNSKITEDDFPGPSQFRLTTSRNRPGPDMSSSAIWWRRKVIFVNLKSGFDKTSCLKSPSGDKRSRLVVSRNCPGACKSLLGTEKSRNWLWLDKVISEILKPLNMDLCSSREIVSLKI